MKPFLIIIFTFFMISFVSIDDETKQFEVNELLGKIDPTNHPDFVKIDLVHTAKKDQYLRKATYQAFCIMADSALKDGIKLMIVSAFRSYDNQKKIWNAKWIGSTKINEVDVGLLYPDPVERAEKILQYSAMPGSSRHHWGTDIDIYSDEESHFKTGEGLKIYQWLSKYAHRFGFCQVYTADRVFGFEEEQWHWSYLPTAKLMLNSFRKQINYSHFNDFHGAKTAKEVNLISYYIVMGINPNCK